MSSRQYAWRHDQVLKCVRRAVARRWQVITEERDATRKWIPKGMVMEGTAIKPDLTLLQETCAEQILITIVDVAVAYDEEANMQRAEDDKIAKYQPLKRVIEERAVKEKWRRSVCVEVVPVVVGTLGVIRKDWQKWMAKLLLPSDEADKLAKEVSCEAIQASKWVWDNYHKIAFGEGCR